MSYVNKKALRSARRKASKRSSKKKRKDLQPHSKTLETKSQQLTFHPVWTLPEYRNRSRLFAHRKEFTIFFDPNSPGLKSVVKESYPAWLRRKKSFVKSARIRSIRVPMFMLEELTA